MAKWSPILTPLKIGDYHQAMDLLSALRLCANVPAQFAVPAALTGPETILELTGAARAIAAFR